MNPSALSAFLTSLVVEHPKAVLGVLAYVLLGLLNGVLPAKVSGGPLGRALHIVLDRITPTVRADAPGTFKWPVLAGSILRGFADALDPPRRDGQSGRATFAVLVVLAVAPLGGGVAFLACGPRPVPIDGGVAVTPSAWTDTARVVITTLRWALPAAAAILEATVPEPARTQVVRALAATTQATARLNEALVAYESAGGDRCLAKSATAGVHAALVILAETLADNGIGIGNTLASVADGLASIVDVLTPACEPDASLRASAGDASNQRLRDIRAAARARGTILSTILDDLRPVADAGVAQ
jgi:hypothetical protein